MSDTAVQQYLEKWDQDQGRAMKFAEKKIRVTRLKKHYWSPQLRNAGLLCRYWNLRIYSVKHNREVNFSISRIQAMIQQHDPRYTFPQQHEALTIQEMIPKWKAAKKALKECQMQAREMRYRSYEAMLVQYKLDRSPESNRRAKIVQRTISTERCRETYRSIRNSTKPFCEHTGGIKNILIPAVSQEGNRTFNPEASETYEWLTQHPEGPQRWDRLIDREEVERYLLHYNRDSFRAASASPCGHGEILNSLSFTSLSDTGHELLHGNIPEAWYGQMNSSKNSSGRFHPPNQGRILTQSQLESAWRT
jgi:hypothetical protein